MTTSKKTVVYVAIALQAFAAACQDSTPIGTVECIGGRIRCGPPLSELVVDQDHVILTPEIRVALDLEEVAPSFVNDPFKEFASTVSLTTDAEGRLWSIAPDGSHIRLTMLDDLGGGVEDHDINAPKAARKDERYEVSTWELNGGGASESQLTLVATWNRDCDGRDDFPKDCQFLEVLAFDDVTAPPRRTLYETGALGCQQANDSGQWCAGDDGHIDKYDVEGELIWRQTGVVAPQPGPRTWSAKLALRPNNELSALVWGPGLNQAGSRPQIWNLDARGNIDRVWHVDWAVDHEPKFAVDARGRNVVAGSNEDGDLVIARLDDGVLLGGVLLRLDYTRMSPDAVATDSDGAFYVASRAGERSRLGQRAVLCQLSDVGIMRCFGLEDGDEDDIENEQWPLIDELVVPEPGVVYARSRSKLRRYDLPSQ